MRKTLPKYYNKEKDLVICAECGKEFKQLLWAHLKKHDMTPQEYLEKYELWKGDLIALSVRQKLSESKKTPENIKRMKKIAKEKLPQHQKKKYNPRFKKMFADRIKKVLKDNKEKQIEGLKKYHQSEQFKKTIKETAKKLEQKITINCLFCKKEFQIIFSKKDTAKFCSNKCKYAYRIKLSNKDIDYIVNYPKQKGIIKYLANKFKTTEHYISYLRFKNKRRYK